MNHQNSFHVNKVEIDNISLEDYVSKGMELVEREESVQWELGDLANDVTFNVGPKYLPEFAKSIRKPVSTIRRYRDVSRAFDPDIRSRFAFVSWSIFRDLCKFDREKKIEILTKAADEMWSYEKFKEMMKPLTAIDDGGFIPPKPEMKFCATCRKWYIVNEKELCPNRGEGPCYPKSAEEREHEHDGEEDQS